VKGTIVREPAAARVAVCCPRCGMTGTLAVLRVTDYSRHVRGAWDIACCPACDLWWLVDGPGQAAPDLAHGDYYTHGPGRNVLDTPPNRFFRRLKREVLRAGWGYGDGRRSPLLAPLGALLARVPWVRRRVGLNTVRLVAGPPRRLLDVGCGNGSYLLAMRRLGWHVEGIEPDAEAAKFAVAEGLPVRVAPLESCELAPASYDAVTLHHVIEHLADPWRALVQLRRALKPGGVLVVVVPNPASAGARRFGPAWRAWDAPRHRALLGPRALARAARDAGLARCRVTSLWRITAATTAMSLAQAEGRPASRARALAVSALLRLRGGWHGGDELLLEAAALP
jgi:SAM-dependent methyltransferase